MGSGIRRLCAACAVGIGLVLALGLLVATAGAAGKGVPVPANTSPLRPLVTTIDASRGVKISCTGKIVYGTLPTRYSTCAGPVGLLYRAGAGAFKVDVTAEGLKPASIQLRATR